MRGDPPKHPDHDYPALYGTRARGSRIIAWCWYHRRYITAPQMTRKKCLRRQCRALLRYEDHPFWRQRRERRQAKKKK